ncbi:MAG: cobyrinate a,c-diamide synthase, partial [Porphyromonas sp.]|nr:cobyrinate a,c-diamide synthase [Porphyromonas sp.]
MTTIPQLLVAATNSGCGKTTFTLGLLRLLRRRGLEVSGFKCGPDYIDPKFHQLASGRESINLDLYMMSPEHVRSTYAYHSQGADAVVVEGVMGLYDGSQKMQGSPAELAQLLDIPVVLLVNAASSAYSVGAIIYGYKHWQPGVRIVGVVFNRVASENHYSFLADAARDAGVESLGYIPRTQSLEVPSRHLGLSLEELARLDAFPDQVADLLEAHVDTERLLSLCTKPLAECAQPTATAPESGNIRIAVAKDEAFNFIYPGNIKALEALGTVVYFSPLADETLPESDLIYLPGGYPEFYLDRLSANSSMRTALRAYAEADGRILAECGG